MKPLLLMVGFWVVMALLLWALIYFHVSSPICALMGVCE